MGFRRFLEGRLEGVLKRLFEGKTCLERAWEVVPPSPRSLLTATNGRRKLFSKGGFRV